MDKAEGVAKAMAVTIALKDSHTRVPFYGVAQPGQLPNKTGSDKAPKQSTKSVMHTLRGSRT